MAVVPATRPAFTEADNGRRSRSERPLAGRKPMANFDPLQTFVEPDDDPLIGVVIGRHFVTKTSTPNLASASVRWSRRCLGALFVVACCLALWSDLVCQFVPSPLGFQLAGAAAIGFGVIFGMWTYVSPQYSQGTAQRTALVARAPYLANPLTRALCLGLFTGLAMFEAVSGAGLEIWTRMTGVPTVSVLHLGNYHSSSRYNCAGFDIQEAPLKLHRFVCASFVHGDEPPPGTPVLVRGPASTFGIDVRAFRIAAES